ncbi:hypothetical protein F0U44_14050 [Nocardioides humilatus]|uniref:Uncharacterized protein n=1 Tax=Nocardioides humilatus TaxID=2607660 RepID=A0A5B1LFW1_9ACTN|nr:hypothetical protein [Nocardioides humilatus]KAA1419543.1 hypothetical protein F0U44_14050 [Nocardioides humilatus]
MAVLALLNQGSDEDSRILLNLGVQRVTRALTTIAFGLSVASCSGAGHGADSSEPTEPVSPATTPPALPTEYIPTPPPEFTSEIHAFDCRAFADRPEVARLVGGEFGNFIVDRVEPGAPYACFGWIADGERAGSQFIFSVTPASESVVLLRPSLKALVGDPTLSPDQLAVVNHALEFIRGGPADDEESCAVFSDVATALHGQIAGANYIVRAITDEDPERLAAFSCTEGIYVAFILGGTPKITGLDDAARDRIRNAVAAYSPGELTEYVPWQPGLPA